MYWSLENVPWTNLHDLNLDWIVNTMKQTVEQWIAYRLEMNQKYSDFTEQINTDFDNFTTQINTWKTLIENEFSDLQTYVQNYFDNLDLNESTRYVINQMIASGEFVQVLNPSIVSAVETWLESHVTPTTPAVDNTLSISGAAADAKVTGDNFNNLTGTINAKNSINLMGMDTDTLYPVYIKAGIPITFSRADGANFGTTIKYAIYGKDKTYIDWFNLGENVSSITKTFSADIYWISWQAGTTLPNSPIMVNIGSVPLPYVPYYQMFEVYKNPYDAFNSFQSEEAIILNEFMYGAIDSSGADSVSTNYLRTGYIEKCILKVSAINSNYVNVYIYDENKNLKTTFSITGNMTFDLTKNDYCYYARVSFRTSSKANITISYIPKATESVVNNHYELLNKQTLLNNLWSDGDLDQSNGAATESAFMARTGYINHNIYINTDGAYNVYVFRYNRNYDFTSVETIAESGAVILGDKKEERTLYIRLATRRENLVSSSVYGFVDDTPQTTFNIEHLYEAGTFSYSDGLIRSYNRGVYLTDYRIAKFLKVKPGTQITAEYNSGTLILYQYDSNKTSGYGRPLYSDSIINLASDTEYVRFEHDRYTLGDTVSVTISGCVKWTYGAKISDEPMQIAYEVFPSFGTDIPATNTTFNTERVFTSGFLMLPPNYSDTGEKVPLIYFAHGSGDYNSIESTSMTNYYMDYYHYLRDEGYAIFDCFGLTDKYGTSGNPMGNPTCLSAIKQGIEWVCKNYNVDINSIYVTGKSLGGIPALAMCYDNGIHIKACAPLAPEIDSVSVGLGYNVATRKGVALDLGFEPANDPCLDEEGTMAFHNFSSAFKTHIIDNVDKIVGYNPMYNGLIGANCTELAGYQAESSQGWGTRTQLPDAVKVLPRICTTPTKIFIAIDDGAVSYLNAKAYIQSIKNAGLVAELRSLPSNTGGHHAVDTDENALKVASITTACGINYTNVPLAYVEMVQFFRRYK